MLTKNKKYWVKKVAEHISHRKVVLAEKTKQIFGRYRVSIGPSGLANHDPRRIYSVFYSNKSGSHISYHYSAWNAAQEFVDFISSQMPKASFK